MHFRGLRFRVLMGCNSRGVIVLCAAGEICGSGDGIKDGEERQEKGKDQDKEEGGEAGEGHHEDGRTKGGKKSKHAEECPSRLTCEGHHQEIDAADEVHHDDHIRESDLRRRKKQARHQRMLEGAARRM
jgi:hypothetical protein